MSECNSRFKNTCPLAWECPPLILGMPPFDLCIEIGDSGYEKAVLCDVCDESTHGLVTCMTSVHKFGILEA